MVVINKNIMPPAPKKKVPKRKSFDSESSDKKSNSDKKPKPSLFG